MAKIGTVDDKTGTHEHNNFVSSENVTAVKKSDEIDRANFCILQFCLGLPPTGFCWCCIHDLTICSNSKQDCLAFCKL